MADSDTSAVPANDSQEKDKGGRPPVFGSLEELEFAIQAYFGEQSPHIAKRKVRNTKADGSFFWSDEEYMTEQKPLTMSGLARALGIHRETLLNYGNDDRFFDTVAQAKRRCEEYAETQLFIGNANGAKFNLSNNYGSWREKSEVTGEQKLVVETRHYDDDSDD